VELKVQSTNSSNSMLKISVIDSGNYIDKGE